MKQAHARKERGAAMVEFALVVPLLVLLVMGVVDFGRAYHVQTSVSNAAREGVRVMALTNDATRARTAAINAASILSPALTPSQIAFSSSAGTSTCGTGLQMTTTVTYSTTYITPLPGMIGAGKTITLTGKGTMRCNG